MDEHTKQRRVEKDKKKEGQDAAGCRRGIRLKAACSVLVQKGTENLRGGASLLDVQEGENRKPGESCQKQTRRYDFFRMKKRFRWRVTTLRPA